MITPLIYGVVIPAALTLIGALGSLFLGRWIRGGAAIGVTAGFVASYFFLQGSPSFPPRLVQDWLPLIAVTSLFIYGFLWRWISGSSSKQEVRWLGRVVVLFFLMFLSGSLVLSSFWSSAVSHVQFWYFLVLEILVLLTLGFLLESIAPRRGDRSLLLALMISLFSLSLFAVSFGSLSIGQLIGAWITGLGVCFGFGLVFRSLSLALVNWITALLVPAFLVLTFQFVETPAIYLWIVLLPLASLFWGVWRPKFTVLDGVIIAMNFIITVGLTLIVCLPQLKNLR